MMKATNGEIGDEPCVEDSVQNAVTLRTVLLSVIVMTAVMTPITAQTFTSIALPQMKLNQVEASWYMSLPTLAALFGTLFNALTLDMYGPRFNILFATTSNTIGWFLVANGQASYLQICLGRILSGFGIGSCGLPCVVYIAESITVNNVLWRSAIGTWINFSVVIGGLLMYILSLSLTYVGVAFVFGVLSTISLILILIFIPESPAWLRGKGRVGDAEIAQQRLGIRQPSILRARKVLPGNKKDDSTFINCEPSSELNSYSLKNLMRYLGQIRRRDVYKPIIITIAFNFFCNFSGVHSIFSNMVDVITVYPMESEKYVLSLVSQIVQIVGCSLLTILTPRCGVRGMAVISFLGASVSQFGLAFSILFENSSLSPNIFNYLHVLSVWAITLASQLGMVALSNSILGELFPMGAKGHATLSLLFGSVFLFVDLKIFPYVYPRYKDVLFFVYGIVCALGAVFVAVFLPETVGKTMEEITGSFDVRSKSVAEDE